MNLPSSHRQGSAAPSAGPPSPSSSPSPGPSRDQERGPARRGGRADLLAAAGAVLLVVAAAVVGRVIKHSHDVLYVGWPPLYADWMPHLGPGTPAAVAVAVLVVAYGPGLAARLTWRRLLGATWLTAMAWTWSLALIDRWHRGVADRLTTEYEYLRGIDRFHDIGAALRDFTNHILLHSPDHWPAHIAGHPPGAVLTFVWLDRVGLGGGAWAAAFVITVAGSAAVAVLVTLRALGAERAARTAAPFLVLAPTAVWAGVSADGYFTAVGAWGIALLTLAATRTVRWPWAAALGAGLVLGFTVYLSYGLTLLAIPAVGVLLYARTARPLPLALGGFAAVAVTFTVAGFQWWEGYDLLVDRYYQGAAADRPYTYFVWANLACTVIIIGPATVAGLRRTLAAAPGAVRPLLPRAAAGVERARTGTGVAPGLVVMVLAGLLALVAADLSGMSKAETERIWQPFAVWLLAACALLPARHRRGWLAAQAAVALLVNHLLLTAW